MCIRRGGIASRRGDSGFPGRGAAERWCPQGRPFHQSGEHVDARGVDGGGQPTDLGRFQQPCHVQAGRTAEHPGFDHPGARHQLQGKAKEKLRINPRKSWFDNVSEVTSNGDYEVTFHLKRPQPSLLSMLATGWTPMYPCHVSPAQMRQHPIGTGPFKFVEFKPNEGIKLARNPDYWKPGRPYLDGIEYSIIPNVSTQVLAFASGKFDMTFPYSVTVPLLKDLRSQMPQAVCETTPMNVSMNLSIDRKSVV